MALKLIWNNIINEPADVIVTPASRKPQIGTGLDKVIHEIGGDRLTAARKELGVIEPGVVKVTPSFGLEKTLCGAKQVIHALGPFCEHGKLNGTERPLLLGCYLQILCTAASLKAKTVALPVMSSGKFGMPMGMAVDIAVEAIQLFLQAVPKLNVKLVGIDDDFREYALKKYPDMTEVRYDKTSLADYRKTHKRERSADDPDCGEAFSHDEDSEYFRNISLRRDTDGKSFHQLLHQAWMRVKAHDKKAMMSVHWKYRLKKDNFKYLLNYADLERRSGITRRKLKRYMSLSEKTLPPSDTVVLLALAMNLPFGYLKAMLISCGYPISGSCLKRRDRLIYDLCAKGAVRGDIDIALEKAGFKRLSQR